MFLFNIIVWPLGFHSTAIHVSGTQDPTFYRVGINTNSGCSIERKGFSSISNNTSDGNCLFIAWLTIMMPSSDFVEIHDYPCWLINSRWCRLLCASSHWIFFFSCTLPSSFLMAYLLFIEQDVGTHFYITGSHSIYVFSSLFIMVIYHQTKCTKETFIYIIMHDKGHNFTICCIALHQLKFFRAASEK